MPTILQFRRGNTSQTTAFTGASGEVSYDTDKKVLVAHDGSTPGGVPLAKESHLASAYALANTKFASAGGTISGDVTVTGNLVISGTTTTVSANNLSIQDNMIYLNNGISDNAYPDLGFAGAYSNGTYQHTGLFRDQSDSVWKFFDGYRLEPDASIYIDTSNSSFRLAPIAVSAITTDTSNVGTVLSGTWTGTSISTTYTDAKTVSVGGQTGVISNTQLLNFISAVDGSGSGLDADLLDGQDSTYYTNATSIVSGTLDVARLSTSGIANTGTFNQVQVDQYGRVVAAANVVSGTSLVKLYYLASF